MVSWIGWTLVGYNKQKGVKRRGWSLSSSKALEKSKASKFPFFLLSVLSVFFFLRVFSEENGVITLFLDVYGAPHRRKVDLRVLKHSSVSVLFFFSCSCTRERLVAGSCFAFALTQRKAIFQLPTQLRNQTEVQTKTGFIFLWVTATTALLFCPLAVPLSYSR